jgi:hypothetical protein
MTSRDAAATDSSWSMAALVCHECCGHDTKAVVKSVRRAVRDRFGKRAVRVTTVGCLDICPKHAVTVVCIRDGRSRLVTVDPRHAEDAVPDALDHT